MSSFFLQYNKNKTLRKGYSTA